ncbi:hypothetical protein M8C21_017349, partial [Ambrosia artemisiifolia]
RRRRCRLHKAIDIESNQIVALKVTPTDKKNCIDPTTLREIGILKLFTDASCFFRLICVVRMETEAMLVLEYVEKDPNRLINRQPIPSLQVQNCHGIGVLHRDLKPDNPLIDGEILKIADLGLGIGTLWYLAPEILWDKSLAYSFGVDIWSSGCIFGGHN